MILRNVSISDESIVEIHVPGNYDIRITFVLQHILFTLPQFRDIPGTYTGTYRSV